MSNTGIAEEAAHANSSERNHQTALEQLKLGLSTARIFMEFAAARRRQDGTFNTEAQRKIVEMYTAGEGVCADTVRAAEFFLEYRDENIALARIFYRMLQTENKQLNLISEDSFWATERQRLITKALAQLDTYISTRPILDLRQAQNDAPKPQP